MLSRFRPCLVLCSSLACIAGCSLLTELPGLSLLLPAIANFPSAVTAEFDIPFAEHDGEPLLYDFYRPTDTHRRLPLVILVHGGFWINGSRMSMTDYAYDLAAQGYATASIDYRLVRGETIFPAPVADVLAAIRYFRENAESLEIDPQRFALFGRSAGAHLALLAGMTDDVSLFDPELPPGEAAGIRAIIAISGPTDLTVGPASAAAWQTDLVETLIGQPPEMAPELLRRASPVHYVREDGPAVLTVHGTLDQIVPISQARLLNASLEQAGQSNVYLEISSMNHINGEWLGWPAYIYRPVIFEFLEENL